jgi:hypothetical protein
MRFGICDVYFLAFIIRFLLKILGNTYIIYLTHTSRGIHVGYWWESQKERNH